MIPKSLIRLMFVLGLLIVTLTTVLAPSAEASACSTCRNSCIQSYRQCLALGELGCDDVLSECVAGCPCP